MKRAILACACAAFAANTPAFADMVPPPADFGANHNYYIADLQCSPIRDVRVTIDVTEDLISTNGLGFQLNAHTLKNGVDPALTWQQYMMGITVNPGNHPVIHDSTQNWANVDGHGKIVVREETDVGNLDAATIPAGSRLEISLHNDAAGNIVAVDYAYTLPHRTPPPPLHVALDRLPDFKPGNIAPIVAYQLNVVGPKGSHLNAGKGRITYQSSTATQAQASSPDCTATHAFTAESINSSYQKLPTGTYRHMEQEFFMTPDGVTQTGSSNIPQCPTGQRYNFQTHTCTSQVCEAPFPGSPACKRP